MDIRDFVAGSTLYVPVHVPGALLWTGDSHAGQGNGEVNLHRNRDRLQGVQHHGRGHQRQPNNRSRVTVDGFAGSRL
jgi:hypothetical protein